MFSCAGDGKIVLKENCGSEGKINGSMNGFSPKKKKKRDPVDIELDVVLGKMPRKVSERIISCLYYP